MAGSQMCRIYNKPQLCSDLCFPLRVGSVSQVLEIKFDPFQPEHCSISDISATLHVFWFLFGFFLEFIMTTTKNIYNSSLIAFD